MQNSITQRVRFTPTFTEDKFERVKKSVAAGETLTKTCRQLHLEPIRFFEWLDKNPVAKTEYFTARDIGHDAVAEHLLTIHEDIEDVAKARLAAENRRWLLARVAASKYGDRLEMNVNGSIDLNAAINAAQQRLISDSANTIEGEVVDYQGINSDSTTDNKSDIDALLE